MADKYKSWDSPKIRKWAKNWHVIEIDRATLNKIIDHATTPDAGYDFRSWFEENLEGPYTGDYYHNFYFAKKSDAMLFKLTWCGDE